eukprot:CAMPEP_0168586850 /NCGR_PEP_ID=MMETSP0420-20121227/4526_1 /TAXON_ID=498008 /ORGANISM="Pessonella sp." /LENGTH=144 /DNA_ID=CAMNT_0008622013 /DNA_START=14 /DNA_END=444 /DNA_ORIENTATION=-
MPLKKIKLGRHAKHRRATLRGMVTNLIKHERILTTVPKAKAAKRMADKMITMGKTNTQHARRRANAYVLEPAAVIKLFGVLAPRFQTRPGGYTRIQRCGNRRSDNAEMCFLSYLGPMEPAKPRKTERLQQIHNDEQNEQQNDQP